MSKQLTPLQAALGGLAGLFVVGLAAFLLTRDWGDPKDYRAKPAGERRPMRGTHDEGQYRDEMAAELQTKLQARWPRQHVKVWTAGTTLRIENQHCSVDIVGTFDEYTEVRAGGFEVVECLLADGHWARYDRRTGSVTDNWER